MKNSFQTKTNGTVKVTADGIEYGGANGLAVVLLRKKFVPRAEVTGVVIGDADRQYVTGKRAVGVLATGGLALLAPSKMTARIAVGTTAGVIEFQLPRAEAKKITLIEALFRSAGYEVVS